MEVTCVKSPPAALKVSLKPCAEVRRRNDGNLNITQVTGNVARRNVQSPAKGYGQVLEVAADAGSSVKTSMAVLVLRANW